MPGHGPGIMGLLISPGHRGQWRGPAARRRRRCTRRRARRRILKIAHDSAAAATAMAISEGISRSRLLTGRRLPQRSLFTQKAKIPPAAGRNSPLRLPAGSLRFVTLGREGPIFSGRNKARRLLAVRKPKDGEIQCMECRRWFRPLKQRAGETALIVPMHRYKVGRGISLSCEGARRRGFDPKQRELFNGGLARDGRN